MPQVRIVSGPDSGKVFKIDRDNLQIGRDPNCNVFLNDKGASRNHSEIFRLGEMCLIRDTGSRNGTFVNDEKIEEELLRHEDIIQVGSTTMVFESNDASAGSQVTYEKDREYRSTLELKIDDLFVESNATRRDPYFRSMAQAAQILQESAGEQDAIEKLLDLIMETIPADNAYVFLRDPDTGAVTPRAWSEKRAGSGIPVSRTILKKVIASGKSIMSSDAMNDERFNAGESIMINKIKAVLCVPLSSCGDVFGALYSVKQSDTETFEEEDLEILTGMGSILAVALKGNISAHQRSEQVLGVLAALIASMFPDVTGVAEHARRAGQFAAAIAEQMQQSREVQEQVQLAGYLCVVKDVFAEYQEQHAEHWKSFITNLESLPHARKIAAALKYGAESFDDPGLPDGHAGEEALLPSKIVAVAGGLNNLLFKAGKSMRSMKDALRQLNDQAGKMYDPEIVRHAILAFRHGRLVGRKRGVARKKL